MGRSICVWLLVCLALASAVPVPGPSTSQDLLNMIFNAKPEDNDIDIHPENPQPLISIAENEADTAEPQVVPPKGEENQDVPQSLEPHETPESETVQEVPEQEQEVPEPQVIPINSKLIPPINEANMQTEQEVEDKISVPEEKDLQTEPEEVMPLDDEQISPEPQEQIFPEPQEQIFPVPQEQISPVPQEQIFPEPQEQISPVPQEQIFPAPEEQIYPVPSEQEVLWEPEEEQIISEPEVYIIPILEEEEERVVPEDEESFPVIEEGIIPVYEEIFPRYEEEKFPMDEEEEINPVHTEEEPIEPYEVQLIPIQEEETEFSPELDETVFNRDEERMPVLDPEDTPEIIVVNLEDFEPDQPISYEPMIPGYVNEEPSDEMEGSPLGSMIPPYFEDEEPQEEIPAMYGESQGPVYFDTFNVPEPFPVVYETPEGYMEESVNEQDEEMEPFMITDSSEESMEMPNEEMPPFIFSDSSEDEVPDTEIFSDEVIDENSDEDLFAGSVFPVNSEGYPYKEGPSDDVMVDYYIPMRDLPVEDARYETDEFDPEYQAPHENSAQLPESVILDVFHPMAVMPEGITPEYESQNFDEDDPIEEFFTPELTDQDDDDHHDFMDEPMMMNEGQRPDISEIMQDTLGNDDQVFLEIISYDPQSFDVKPEDVLKVNAQQIIANEEIIPIAGFPKKEMTPFEKEIYWIPENNDEEPIIFPEDFPPQRRLPIFPYQWREENYFQPPRNEHVSSYDPPQHDEQPYYGPFPQEEPPFMFDMPNEDDITPNMPDFMSPSQEADMPREDMFPTIFDDDDDDMNLDFPDVLYQNSEISDYPKKFINPNSFDLPSLPDMALNQDFHGPNTFPLNFRRAGHTPDFFDENFNSYNQRFTPEYNNHDRIYPENTVAPKDFQQGTNYHNTPNSMHNTPNMFSTLLTKTDKMDENRNEQDMNMNLKVFRPSSMPMNSNRFNQRQQQFDVQVFYIPYRNNYNQPQYGQHGQRDYRNPYAQQTNTYNTYQGQSYNVDPYSRSNTYQNARLYSHAPVPNRYDMNYNYRDYYHYNPYNFPMSTW